MLTALWIEARKLNRSLAALLAVIAPALIGVFAFFMLTRGDKPQTWLTILQTGSGIWGFFMMPMSITALTALMAHMEHAPKSWDHLRALPVPRWRIYAAKAACTAGVVAAMSLGVLVSLMAAGWFAGIVKPQVIPTGDLNLIHYVRLLAMMWAAGLLMIALQLWVALRFSNFVPGLALGIGGTFFAVVATNAKEGAFMPWQMPVHMMQEDPERVALAFMLGAGGGAVVLVLMLIHLSWREVT